MSINRITSLGRLRVILVCSGLALFIGSALIAVNPTHAQEWEESEPGFVPPENPGEAQKRYKPEVVLPSGYPNGFHGFGRIDMLEEDGVVIQDISIKLSASVSFNTPTNKDCTRFEFNEGDLVGYLKGIGGEITSLWLIQ